MTNHGKLTDYRNLDRHWFKCSVCGGASVDSDTAALMGKDTLTPANVMHDTYCPGKAFPDNHVRRITALY